MIDRDSVQKENEYFVSNTTDSNIVDSKSNGRAIKYSDSEWSIEENKYHKTVARKQYIGRVTE